MGRPDKAKRAAIVQRRADAIELRLAGVDWLTIARKLAADPAVNCDRIAYPQGYGCERYARSQQPPADDQLINYVCRDVRQTILHPRMSLSLEGMKLLSNLRTTGHV